MRARVCVWPVDLYLVKVMTEAAQLKRYHRELAELRRQVAMLQQEVGYDDTGFRQIMKT